MTFPPRTLLRPPFGFASVLPELGLPQETLVLSLLGFNLGVETGQLAIVAWCLSAVP